MPLSDAEATALLTAPGAPYEMEEVEVRGVRVRSWVRAPRSLRAVVEDSVRHGDREFLVLRDRRLSFAEHHRTVCRFATALRTTFGVGPGDRVVIAMRNLPEWSIAFFATTSIGAIAVPLNAWWTGRELRFGIEDSGAVVAVVDAERAERLAETGHPASLRAVIVAGGGAHGLRFDDVVEATAVDAPLPDARIAPDDDATIFYTSGTTGLPKGAVGTHRNICSNILNRSFFRARALVRNGGDPHAPSPPARLLLSVPLFHVTGCHSYLLPALALGSLLVLMHKWDPEEALDLVERERLTAFGGVPAMAMQALDSPTLSRRDLSSVTTVVYGGAPAPPELVRRIGERVPAALPANGYGMTETSAVSTYNFGEDYRRFPDSVGPVVPVMDAKIVDERGEALPTGAVGELWVRGPNVVRGYWNRPEETAEAITDGWLHTGDVARMNDEGFVFIVDRAKDMVIRGGENVYCVEVESALYEHPAVVDAAVVGIPHEVLGEEVAAIVHVREGADVTEAALQEHVRSRLAAFKVPVRIDVRTEELPRSPQGKILKRQLRDALLR